MSEQFNKPIKFQGNSYRDPDILTEAMAMDWDAGRKMLFSGSFSSALRQENKALASAADSARREYQNRPENGDLLFWKFIYRHGKIKRLYWKRHCFGNWKRVSSLMRQGNDHELNRFTTGLLKEQLFSVYAKSAGASEQTIESIRYIEKCHNRMNSSYRKSLSRVILATVMDGNENFTFDGHVFKTVEEFSACLQDLTNGSKERFEHKIRMLFYDEHNLDPNFTGWLLNKGHSKALEAWNRKYQGDSGNNDDDGDDGDNIVRQELTGFTDMLNEKDVDFARDVLGFEQEFTQFLQSCEDALEDAQRFTGLIKDIFPTRPLQMNLLLTVYKMDIVRAIRDASEMNQVFANRFEKRLVRDFGVKQNFAKWAVSIWCVCLGEQVLGKPCRISVEPGI